MTMGGKNRQMGTRFVYVLSGALQAANGSGQVFGWTPPNHFVL